MINKVFGAVAVCLAAGLSAAHAEEIDKNTAQMQAMDKITGRVSKIEVPVGGEIKFGSLSIVVRSCKTRPEEETPDNFAFADITDKTLQGDIVNIFRGWMISSSPATHAVEHPIYDVWLLKCLDTKVDKAQLLSDEALAARETLPMVGERAVSLSVTLDKQQIKEIADVEHHENTEAPQNMEAVEFLYDEDAPTENLPEEVSIPQNDLPIFEQMAPAPKSLHDVISEIAERPE